MDGEIQQYQVKGTQMYWEMNCDRGYSLWGYNKMIDQQNALLFLQIDQSFLWVEIGVVLQIKGNLYSQWLIKFLLNLKFKLFHELCTIK